MRVADGVEMLEVVMNVSGVPTAVYPTMLLDDDGAVLVDVPGVSGLEQALGASNMSLTQISRVIITHQDLDHISGLPGLRESLSPARARLEIIAHPLEIPYIQGEKRLLKITDQVLASMQFWPEQLRATLKPILENPPKAPVDSPLDDGKRLTHSGGIMVIHTPGHSPGHVCLYHEHSNTLIAGDALVVKDGELSGPTPEHCHNYVEAILSLSKLSGLPAKRAICYHGGLYEGDVIGRISRIISNSGVLTRGI